MAVGGITGGGKCVSVRRVDGVEGWRSIRRADAAVVVHAISVTVLRLVSGGLYGGPGGETSRGDAVTATTARTPLFLCEERSGHSKAPQPCGTVVPPLSRPPRPLEAGVGVCDTKSKEVQSAARRRAASERRALAT